jgi:Protein of unknown function (DUF1552)
MNALANRSRRSFMKTLAGIGAASQFAGLFRDVWAASTPTLPRFVVLSSPHGYAPTYWRPRAADGVGAPSTTGWTLDFPNSSLAPLQKHKDSLVIIEGLDLTTDTAHPDFYTGGHNCLSVLTGWHPQGAEGTPGQYKASGPSIDVAIAKLLNTTEFLFTPIGYGGAANTIGSFRADGSAIAAEYSLKKSLANWFANVGTGAADAKATARKNAQTAVLDYLGADARRLRGRLAGPEKAKLDAHLDALSGITQKINTVVSISCAKPTNAPDGDAVKPAGDKYIPVILDFTAQLLACNLTRVVHVSIDPINSGTAPWLQTKDPVFKTAGIHDDIAHGFRPSDDNSQRLLSIMINWYAQQVSYFIDLLKAIPEGTGTAYDNTILLWDTELGDPARHMHTNVPYLLAGGGGSYAKGRYLPFGLGLENANPTDPHNKLLTSLANQYGANLPVFGDPKYPGELPGL